MIPIVLIGAAGRMGRAVAERARADREFQLRACVDVPEAVARLDANPPGGSGVWSADAGKVIRGGDVVVEFSTPAACRAAAALCAERGAALVSGTTGLAPADEAAVKAAAAKIPVVRAANFSLGIAALHRALEAVLDALPSGWDVEIIERHHRHKADSPSGTALALARAALARRGGGAVVPGRSGRTGERPAGEIGVHAVRGGSWVGDHSILIAGEGDWIELSHGAQDRSAFATGALAAARFVASAKPGSYTLDDVLGAHASSRG